MIIEEFILLVESYFGKYTNDVIKLEVIKFISFISLAMKDALLDLIIPRIEFVLLSAYSSIFVNSLFKFTVGMNINILNSY
jgi:hypothetical protein